MRLTGEINETMTKNQKTGNAMQLNRFLSSYTKLFLVLGALSISTFATADLYNQNVHDIHRDQGFVVNNHDSIHHNNFHDQEFVAHEGNCAPIEFHNYANTSVESGRENVSCNYCSSSCVPSNYCGSPCLEAPALSWGYNPPAYSRCGCDTACDNGFLDSFAFRADFLWWRANEGGLDLGTVENVVTNQGTGTPIRSIVVNTSRSKKPNFKHDPGFRIGIANHRSCDCWDFAVNWTSFHTKAVARALSANDIINESTFFSDWERVVNANSTAARGRYSLNLDLVDIEFGRKFYVSNCFILRPDFGLRIARIHQTYRVESGSFVAGSEAILGNYVSNVKSRSNFLAVGPRVGLDIELQFCNGISLFGCAAGSIVFGKFDNHSRETLINRTIFDGSTVGTFNYDQNGSGHRCSRTITDLAVGIKWIRCFEWCNRSHPVSLAFAWEHHAFYDLNSFNFASNEVLLLGNGNNAILVDNDAKKYGNLTTQGLTLSLGFGF